MVKADGQFVQRVCLVFKPKPGVSDRLNEVRLNQVRRVAEIALGLPVFPAQRHTLLNIRRCRPFKKASSRTLRLRSNAQAVASAMFCCSSSFNSLRSVICVGINPSRSAGVNGVAGSSASAGPVTFHPKAWPVGATAAQAADGAVPWQLACLSLLDLPGACSE